MGSSLLRKVSGIALVLACLSGCGSSGETLSYAGCALDLVPFVGSIDEVVTSGAKGLDEALGDMASVRRAGEEGSEARRVFSCASSFAADTRVLMADGSTKRIVDVEPGDMVMSADPETGEQAPREVVATLPHTDDLLLFDTSAGRVVTTEDHRYWNATDGEWQQSQDLDPGDLLLSADGDLVTVGGLDWTSLRTAPAYDLTIADFHAFYVAVGNKSVLVHNNECLSAAGGGALPPLRQAYVDDFAKLRDEVDAWRRAGADPEFIAREANANRRALGMKYKDLTPEPLRSQIRDRNLATYGDEWGPTIDWFRARGDSWEQIIESSLRPGGGDLGF